MYVPRNWPDLWRDCDVYHFHGFQIAAQVSELTWLMKGLRPIHLDNGTNIYMVCLGIDLTYEGIATEPLCFHFLPPSPLLGIDLTYEGIATPLSGRPCICANLGSELTWLMKGLRPLAEDQPNPFTRFLTRNWPDLWRDCDFVNVRKPSTSSASRNWPDLWRDCDPIVGLYSIKSSANTSELTWLMKGLRP